MLLRLTPYGNPGARPREQKTRHRMDSLNRRRVVPANGKLSAEISPERSARQQVEHEPKRRKPSVGDDYSLAVK